MLTEYKMKTRLGTVTLTESRVKLKIRGVTKPQRLVHISDCHICTASPTATDEERAQIEKRISFLRWQGGLYYDGGETRVEPCDALEAVAARVRELSPDLVMLSGDIADLQTEPILRSCISYKGKLGARTVIAPGNRDHLTVKTDELDELRGRVYGRRTFGGITVRDMGKYDVITLDDGFTVVSASQCRRLEELLRRDRQIIVCLHVPILSESVAADIRSFRGYGWMLGDRGQKSENYRLIKLLCDNAPKIAGVFSGHVHLVASEDEKETRASILECIAERAERNWEIAEKEGDLEKKRFCDVFLDRGIAVGETKARAEAWRASWDGEYTGGAEEYPIVPEIKEYVAAPAFGGFLRVIDVEG